MTKRNRKKQENVQDVNHFMHEVEEAMHLETMLHVWNTYKTHIISAFIAAFVVVTAWQWYVLTLEKGLASQATTLWEAETQLGESKINYYQDLLENGSKAYSLLSSFKIAENYLEKGDTASAIATYDAVINGNELKEFRQLAMFYKGLALSSSSENLEEAETLFKEILASEGAFVMSAKEMLAIIAEQNGDVSRAIKLYESALVNPSLPQGMRARAQSRLSALTRNNKNTAN